MPTCIWGCSGDDIELSQDHIFGRKWVERHMPLDPGVKYRHRFRQVEGQSDFDTQWQAAEAGITVSDVCKKCNNEWMNDLDDATYPHIDPMVDGWTHPITASEHEQIARWAVFKAICFDQRLEHPAITAEMRRSFRDNPQPFPETFVWIGRYDISAAKRWVALGVPTTKAEHPKLSRDEMTLCTMVINSLVLQVAINVVCNPDWFLRMALAWEERWSKGGYLLRLWPSPAAKIHWPPITASSFIEPLILSPRL